MNYQTEWWRIPVINRRAWRWEDRRNRLHRGEWWQHAVIYQIFPQSFLDSDGDGIGDIKGITRKLEYIRSLGVEAIWLNPFFPSNHEDAGYDVTNLKEVDELMGSLQGFRELLDVAHGMGLKIIIDQVWNHTSDQHPWFLESKSNRVNDKADWFVWQDGQDDGGPPNNWLSAFTGESAWCWCDEREQYYLANFMKSQPDLNWHNDQVVKALMKNSERWLQLGVDGFRIDAVNFFVHDANLRDNPSRRKEHGEPDGISMNNPMAQQLFTNSFCRPETVGKLQAIRELMDRYPHTMTLGEVTLCEDSIELSSHYVEGDDGLHLVYNSALLQEKPLTASMLRAVLSATQRHFPEGGQCWMVGNHDYQRLSSRWTGCDARGNAYPLPFYRMVAALLISLPGALCLYQGDELGLPLATIPGDIAPDRMQDPYGKCQYPQVKGRDVSRTPMPWDSAQKHLGFSTAEQTWLPVPDRHHDMAVDRQNLDPDSLLNTWRKVLQRRAAQPALMAGDYTALESHDSVFAFLREYAEQTLYCFFNLSAEPCRYPFRLQDCIGKKRSARVALFTINQNPSESVGKRDVELDAYGALLISITGEQTHA